MYPSALAPVPPGRGDRLRGPWMRPGGGHGRAVVVG